MLLTSDAAILEMNEGTAGDFPGRPRDELAGWNQRPLSVSFGEESLPTLPMDLLKCHVLSKVV
jgi:hypothetical protein